MSYRTGTQDFLKKSAKLVFISSPLFFFLAFLLLQNRISTLDFIISIILLALSLTGIHGYVGKKHASHLKDRKTSTASQFLLKNIMEKLSDPFLLLDPDNRILMANASAHKLLGAHILKQNISIFIRSSNLEEAMQRAYKTGTPESCEFKFGEPYAKHYLTRINLFDLDSRHIEDLDMEGAPLTPHQDPMQKRYIFLAIYDVSAMKRSDKMRVDFVANASHELRTPLASILGFIETLLGPARDDEEARERFLKIMHDEANRMSRLIEDLLSLSRIERDEHIPPSGSVDLARLIESAIEVLEPQAKDKNMTIHLSRGTMSDITGDPDQLTQVFQNLIENAIKYGREHTEITVTCTEDTRSAPLKSTEINVTVTNEGPGIPAKHLPRLMERFYRVDSARSRSLGGTGLGLAIVKHIIQRHRGHIFFESEIDAKTTVTLSLPGRSTSSPSQAK